MEQLPTMDRSKLNPEFRIVGKRRFLLRGNNKYMLPVDQEEMDRLNFQHSVIK